MPSPLISIVVPVYNTVKYLQPCIDSILAQSVCDMEVLLVDDGSQDESGRICDDYARKDHRIRVIHQVNSGVTAARGAGVSHSLGKYLTFVDADDTLPPTALQCLLAATEEGTYSIVIGSVDRYDYMGADRTLSPETYRHLLIKSKIMGSPYARVFARELFDDNTFNIPRQIRRGEDKLMNVRLAFSNRKPVKQISTIVYHYRNNTESVMHTFHSTVEHKQLFLKHFALSIPHSERRTYLDDFIVARLGTLREVAFEQPVALCQPMEWTSTLKRDIMTMKHRLSLAQRIFLYSSSAFLIRATCLFIRIRRKVAEKL